MDNFAFTPTEGFRNGTSFPDPSTETEAREQLQRLHDQTRDFINGIVGAVNDNAADITALETQLTEDINSIRRVYFGTCSTVDGTTAKVVTTTSGNFELKAGNLLVVYFSQPNTRESALLKVDGLASKEIASPSNINQKDSITWISGVVAFIYDGEKFRIVNRPIGDIETYGMVKLSDAVDSTSESSHGRTASTPYAVKKVKDALDNLSDSVYTKTETDDLLDAKADVSALWETNRNVTTNELNIGRIYDDLHDIFPEHTKNGSGASFTGANYIRLGGSDIYGNQIATKDYVDDAVDIPVASPQANGLMPSEFYQTVNSIKFHYQMIITAGNTSNQIFFVFPNTRMELFNVAVSAYEYDSSASRFTKKDVGWTLEYNGQVIAGYAYRFEATIDSASANPIYVNIYSNATGYTR